LQACPFSKDSFPPRHAILFRDSSEGSIRIPSFLCTLLFHRPLRDAQVKGPSSCISTVSFLFSQGPQRLVGPFDPFQPQCRWLGRCLYCNLRRAPPHSAPNPNCRFLFCGPLSWVTPRISASLNFFFSHAPQLFSFFVNGPLTLSPEVVLYAPPQKLAASPPLTALLRETPPDVFACLLNIQITSALSLVFSFDFLSGESLVFLPRPL